MVENYSPGSRAAAFFAGFGFLVSQMAENVYGNAYAGGSKLNLYTFSFSCNASTYQTPLNFMFEQPLTLESSSGPGGDVPKVYQYSPWMYD
jgi:hypothetical protein